MKKVFKSIVSLALAILFLGTQTFANGYKLISLSSDAETGIAANFDESDIYNAFAEVDDLVNYIENHDAVSYSDVENANSNLLENVSSSAAIAMNSSSSDAPPFISAFLWGCIFNWVGIVIVGVTTDFDSDQLRKSVWGCLINSLLIGVSYGSSYSY